MALLGDDCFFYYNAGCQRGVNCKFRHQPAATVTSKTCPDWLKGSCTNINCILRHAVIDNGTFKRDSSNIPCKFESSTGCLNENCSFMHKVPKVTQSNADVLPMASLHLKMQPNSVSINGFPSALPTNVVGITKPVRVPFSTQITPGIVSAPGLHHSVIRNSSFPLNLIHQPIQQAQVATLGTQVVGAFPKSEHFSEQVRLFKEMLAARGKGPSSQGSFSDDNDDDEEPHRSLKHKYKDRQKSKKSRKHRDGTKHKSSYKKYTQKTSHSKDNKDIIYDDYEDVKFDEKPKKKYDKHASSDSEVNIKTYEEILREKALRKLIEKRKDKFEAEFDSLLERDKSTSKKSRKRSKSAESNDPQDNGRSREKRTKSIDVEAFTEDDALELGLDASPIREALDEPVLIDDQSNGEKIFQSDSPVLDNIETTDAGVSSTKDAIVIIPDETTDINFSVDDNDDLALELNQTEESSSTGRSKNPKSRRLKSKPISKSTERTSSNKSSKNTIKLKISDKSSKSTYRPSNSASKKTDKDSTKNVKQGQGLASVVNVISKPTKKSLEEISSSSKRKVINLALDNNTTNTSSVAQKAVKSPILFPVKGEQENKPAQVVPMDKQQPSKLNQIQVKSFNEIMAEKRKRKFGKEETNIISDDTNSSISEDNEKVEKRKTSNVLPVRKLKNKNVVEEEKVKRKSVQLYKPPVTTEPSLQSQNATESNQSMVNLSPKKVVVLQKPTGAPDKKTTKSNKSTLPTKKLGVVMSFEEIMRAKRLRKQQEHKAALSEKQIDEIPAVNHKKILPVRKPILRRSSLSSVPSNKVDGQPGSKEKIEEAKIARVSPLQAVPVSPNSPELSIQSPQVNDCKESEEHSEKTDERQDEVVHSMSTSKKPLPPIKHDITSPPSSTPSQHQLNVVKPLTDESELADSPHSMDEIKEALDNEKRKKESDLLSDDEFEKEINDLCSGNDEDFSDIDENDLMMELEQMIDS